MAKKQNLSEHDSSKVPSAAGRKIGIVVSEWNAEVTEALKNGALETLLKYGAKKEDITLRYVPGSFELPMGAQMMFDADEDLEAVICLGCIIQGETRHFEFIANATANGIMNVGREYGSPVIFGILTTNDMQQAMDRAGGKHGNKGVEAAVTCIKMLAVERSLH